LAENRTPVIAGLGGVALAAALFSGAGHVSSIPRNMAPAAQPPVAVETASTTVEPAATENGPWYAFCREYVTTGFDHGIDPKVEPGVREHQVPSEADAGSAEIRRPVFKGDESEKFNVKTHVVGYLPSCVPKDAKVRVMIATVPDPDMTEMPLEFDRDIDAIQEAAGKDYIYTGYWFPWRPPDWTADKGADPEIEERRREEPGILCFRKQESQATNTITDDRLFVFLVGETPTSGANRHQLAHALYYWEQLRVAGDFSISSKTQDLLQIAGPHFSASFPVLKDVLTDGVFENHDALHLHENLSEPLPRLPAIQLISPDSSGISLIDNFSSYCASESKKLGAPPCTVESLSLRSNDADKTALKYLTNIGYKPNRIAELSEDESAYGTIDEGAFLPSDEKSLPPALNSHVPDSNHLQFGLRLKFPRDLSALRTISDRESEQVAESGAKYFSLPKDSLDVHLTAQRPLERDTPAYFGEQQAAAEAARSLADAIEEMRANHVQAIVISATNPLDRVYLLEYMKEELPDVRTVTIDADELELGNPHFMDFSGSIAITALPPLAALRPVDRRGKEADSPFSFRSSRQEGEFLAVGMLLDPGQNLSDQEFKGSDARCLAVSVVEKDGFRLMPGVSSGFDPLTFPCFVNRSKAGQLSQVVSEGHLTVKPHTEVPRSFVGFLLFICGLDLAYAIAWRSSKRGKEGFFSFPHRLLGRLENRRIFMLLIANNQLLLINLVGARVTSSILLNPDVARVRLLSLSSAAVAVSCALLAALSVLMLADQCIALSERWKQSGIPGKARREMLSDFVCLALALVYFVWTAVLIYRLPAFQPAQLIFLERTTVLSEGLSPILPITTILIGYGLWAWMHLKRLDWIASRRIWLQLNFAESEVLRRQIETMQSEMESVFSRRLSTWTIGLCLAAITYCCLKRSDYFSFENSAFNIWFRFWGIIVLLFMVFITCAHAWSIWDYLKRLLEWLETTFVREAFQAIGERGTTKIKIWDLTKKHRSFTVLQETVLSLFRIRGYSSVRALRAERFLQKFISYDEQNRQVPPRWNGLLSRALNIEMKSAVKWTLNGSETEIGELQIYLALRLVAFIRYAMLQIVTLVTFVAYGFVAAVASIMFYPFAGARTIGEFLSLAFLALFLFLAVMLVQFQRNGMLSRLEGTAPGEVSYLQVAFHLFTVGGLPLLAILTSQFPAVAQLVFSIFRPVLGALH
jgi:hypothetical protein